MSEERTFSWRDTPAPQIESITRLANGQMQLIFTAVEGQTHLVQASADLLTWQALGSATPLGNGRYEFQDSNSLEARRFYQVLSP